MVKYHSELQLEKFLLYSYYQTKKDACIRVFTAGYGMLTLQAVNVPWSPPVQNQSHRLVQTKEHS